MRRHSTRDVFPSLSASPLHLGELLLSEHKPKLRWHSEAGGPVLNPVQLQMLGRLCTLASGEAPASPRGSLDLSLLDSQGSHMA